MKTGKTMQDSGSATLQVLVVLVFLAAVCAAAVAFAGQARHAARFAGSPDSDADLFAVVAAAARLLADPDGLAPHSFSHPVYTMRADGFEVKVRELSSMINPNWLSISILETPQLGKLLSSTDVPLLLQQSRYDLGFSTDLRSRYGEYFIAQAFESYLSPFSYADINTMDEFAFERVVADCTGDVRAAEELRRNLRRRRESTAPLSDYELVQLFGVYNRELSVFITNRPQWNVNCMDPQLLRALLAYSPLDISGDEILAATLLGARGTRPISDELLRSATGLPEGHRLFAWLGTTSWFWEVEVHDNERKLTAILARVLPTTYNDLSLLTPVIQLVEWTRGEYDLD